jgi:hypothetical protein
MFLRPPRMNYSNSPPASPPPSPRSLEQTEQFFAKDQIPPKRPRVDRVVVESFFEDTQTGDVLQQMPSTTLHPGSAAIVAQVPETPSQSILIPGTLQSQLPATDPRDDDLNSCSGPEHAGQSAAAAEQGSQSAAVTPHIPPEWTACNGVVVNFLSAIYFYSPGATGDGSFKIKFQWESATAETALTFLTSGILGTQAKRGMGNYLRHALKTLVQLTEKDPAAQPSSLFFAGLLNAGQKAISSSHHRDVEFKQHFKTAFDACKAALATDMNKYVLSYPVKLYMTTNDADDARLLPTRHLPQHSEINALARVVVLMSDAQVFPTVFMRVYFHRSFTGAGDMAGYCK